LIARAVTFACLIALMILQWQLIALNQTLLTATQESTGALQNASGRVAWLLHELQACRI
jgi:hypothetical protein